MNLCEWFISYVLPLFCDVTLLTDQTMESLRTFFALTVGICAIDLLIVFPYKITKRLLKGGKK